MRPIDADALDSVVFRMNTEKDAQITRLEYKLIDSVIFEFPTIDAVPVRHGKWIRKNVGDEQYDYCSECRYIEWNATNNYCPNCGAKMDKEKEE